jgi:hypothetical protein
MGLGTLVRVLRPGFFTWAENKRRKRGEGGSLVEGLVKVRQDLRLFCVDISWG